MASQLVWLITGCSTGFGQALAREVLARGDLAIATARKLVDLEPLRAEGATVLQLDVTAEQDELNAVIEAAVKVHGRVDVLVNNAGYVHTGAIEETSAAALRQQFETNVFGPMRVTTALLPHFRARRAGINVFISSLSGHVGHPFTGPYAGSKFALEGLVESLAAETQSFGIQTLLVEPGRFRTRLLAQGNRKDATSSIPDYVPLVEQYVAALDAASERQPGDTEKGVRIIVDVVRKEGNASGKTIPFRLLLGSDSYDEIKKKIDQVSRDMEEWKAVTLSTDHAE